MASATLFPYISFLNKVRIQFLHMASWLCKTADYKTAWWNHRHDNGLTMILMEVKLVPLSGWWSSAAICCLADDDSTPWMIFRCFFRYVDCLNPSGHIGHWYGLDPVCTMPCLERLPGRVNLFLQMVHSYGLAFVCTLEWRSSSPDRLKARPHSVHLYGFSPEWLRKCTISSLDVVNRFLQTLHWNDFSPLWNFMWMRRCSERPNDLPHVAHWYGFSPVWILVWRASWPILANRLLHTVHSYGRSPVCVRRCIVSAHRLSKQFPHSPHTCRLLRPAKPLSPGRSPCFFWCQSSRCFVTNRLSHLVHGNGRCPVCVLMWTSILPLCENCFSHIIQVYGFGFLLFAKERECSIGNSLRTSSSLSSSVFISRQSFPAHVMNKHLTMFKNTPTISATHQ